MHFSKKKKCGYGRLQESENTENMTALGRHQTTEPKIVAKAQCVYRNAKRLQDEAQLHKFARFASNSCALTIVANPESKLGYRTAEEFPRTSTVSGMAVLLQETFSAHPNPNMECIMYKIYAWVCGKSIEIATNVEDEDDDRLITGNGIYDSDVEYWRKELGVPELEDDFFDKDK